MDINEEEIFEERLDSVNSKAINKVDAQIYLFTNETTGETFKGTCIEFCNRIGLDISAAHYVCLDALMGLHYRDWNIQVSPHGMSRTYVVAVDRFGRAIYGGQLHLVAKALGIATRYAEAYLENDFKTRDGYSIEPSSYEETRGLEAFTKVAGNHIKKSWKDGRSMRFTKL